jgi:hypothetical protein
MLLLIAVHAQTTPVATSRRPAATSYLPLLVPSYLVFTVTSDQKAPCYILITSAPQGPMVTVSCHSNPSLSFLSTIIQQRALLVTKSCVSLYCTACQQGNQAKLGGVGCWVFFVDQQPTHKNKTAHIKLHLLVYLFIYALPLVIGKTKKRASTALAGWANGNGNWPTAIVTAGVLVWRMVLSEVEGALELEYEGGEKRSVPAPATPAPAPSHPGQRGLASSNSNPNEEGGAAHMPMSGPVADVRGWCVARVAVCLVFGGRGIRSLAFLEARK